jgi:hypothetical protein
VAGEQAEKGAGPVDESDILSRVHDLVQTERELRAGGHESSSSEAQKLQQIEVSLDQCWDLLRQRRAHQEFGQPDDSAVRPADTVEHYLQ